jgi:acetyltransferase EpsM
MSQSAGLIVIGGGEHARVVAEAATTRADLWTLRGYCDVAAVPEMEKRLKLSWLGDDAKTMDAHPDAQFVLAVGEIGPARKRREIAKRFDQRSVRWGNVVHRAATVSPNAQLGRGVSVMAGAVINSGARIGDHVIVNTGAIVEHDVELGAFAHVGPGAVIGGGAKIGENSYLGLGSRVRDHISVGRDATVGMGAVVTASVGDAETVVGVPAKRIRGPR